MVGKITCGRPRVMQRSYQSSACGPSNGLLPVVRAFTATVLRFRASSLRNGMRPSGGSITTEVRRDGRPRSSQCPGGPVPSPPPRPAGRSATNASASCAACRCACVTAGVELLFRHDGAGAELRRALERHAQLVVGSEDALQVGVAPGSARLLASERNPRSHISGTIESAETPVVHRRCSTRSRIVRAIRRLAASIILPSCTAAPFPAAAASLTACTTAIA